MEAEDASLLPTKRLCQETHAVINNESKECGRQDSSFQVLPSSFQPLPSFFTSHQGPETTLSSHRLKESHTHIDFLRQLWSTELSKVANKVTTRAPPRISRKSTTDFRNPYDPYFRDTQATPFEPESLSSSVSKKDSTLKNIPCLTPSIIVSIGQHYNLLRSSSAPEGRFSLSVEAASILASALEFRLRLVIQEAKKFCRASVASGVKRQQLTISNVLAAFDMLRIDLNADTASVVTSSSSSSINQLTKQSNQDYNNHVSSLQPPTKKASTEFHPPLFMSLGPTSLNPIFASIPPPAALALSAFPLDILAKVIAVEAEEDVKDRGRTDSGSFQGTCKMYANGYNPIINTKEYAKEMATVPYTHGIKLPKLLIHWVAVNGYLVSSPLNVDCFSPSQDEEAEALIKSYDIQLRVPDRFDPFQKKISNLRRFGKHLASLGVVSQASKVLHALSREHLLLLNQVRDILRRPFQRPSDEHSDAVTEVLQCIRSSPGLGQLTPYLVYFASCQIYAALSQSNPYPRPAAGIRVLLKAMLALVHNSTLQLHLLVHQILQTMQYIVLHPLLGIESMTLVETTLLRYFAAQAVSAVVHRFSITDGGTIAELVCGIYGTALRNATQPLSTLLGATIGVRCIGRRAVQTVLLPVIPLLAQLLHLSFFNSSVDLDSNTKQENQRSLTYIIDSLKQDLVIELLGAIVDALGDKQKNSLPSIVTGSELDSLPLCPSLVEALQNLQELLGDGLTPYILAGKSRLEKTLPSDTAIYMTNL